MTPSATTPTAATCEPGELFDAWVELSPLRVITTSGPSVFETICSLPAWGVHEGWMNAITPEFHWHLGLDGLGHVTTRDQVHARSGRRVLFFELREKPDDEPFLRVYLHRGRDEEFGDAREQAFDELHRRWSAGADVETRS